MDADIRDMEYTRQEERNLCADLLKVRWRSADGSPRNEFATLEDISSSGACIQLEEAIAAGTRITLFYPAGKYRGRVKYSITHGNVYLVGVEFDPGYRWSRKDYRPSHLLQFQLRPVRPRRNGNNS